MLTAEAISGLQDHLKNQIAYAMYKVGDSLYRADINSVSVQADGNVYADFMIDHTVAGDITVDEVRLYNAADVMIAQKAESINRAGAAEGILYRFRFTITEA